MSSLRFPLIVLTGSLACSSPTAPSAEGAWGGETVSLSLSRSGGVLTYQCGAGTIDPGWTLSREGHLTGTGQHFFGGGPVPPQGRVPHPAQYAGGVSGSAMFLTVTVTDVGQTLGPFILLRGGPEVHELCQ